MLDLAIDTEPQAPVEVRVGEPPMKGFMRSFGHDLTFGPDLEWWERDELFREEVEIPLTRFADWVKAVGLSFLTTGSLNNNQLGPVEFRPGKNGKHGFVRHVATGLEATGKDEAEARVRLKDQLVNLLGIWQEEGDLFEQVEQHRKELLAELRTKFELFE